MPNLLSTCHHSSLKSILVLSFCLTAFWTQAGEKFSFSYTFDASARGTPGEILSGVVEGQLTEDGDTILIDRFIKADLSGIKYNISASTEIRAADPTQRPKMSISGKEMDFWVCAEGFDVYYENGEGDCIFGETGGFLVSPYVDVQTAECIQLNASEQCINWAWAGIPDKTNAYRVGDIPAIQSNWVATKLQPSTTGEIVHPIGNTSQPVLFSFDRDKARYSANAVNNAFSVTWQGSYSEVKLYMFPDMNGNGSPEIGLFGIRSGSDNEGKPQLIIKDTASGNRISVLNWVAHWSNTSIVVLPDITGDGVVDIGLQGLFKEGQRPQLIVRDGITNASLVTYSFPSLWQSPQYISFSDMTHDGVKEVALFGRIKSNQKPQIKVLDGTNSKNKLKSYTFPNKWSDTRWLNVGDYNSDGEDDWALLGRSNLDRRWQLIIKDGTDPKGALAIYAWPDLDNIILDRISDFTDDGIDEFILGGFNDDKNRWQLQIKHGQNRNVTLKNISWPDRWLLTSLHVLSDLDSDGIEEVALLGWNNGYQLMINSSRSDFDKSLLISLGDEWDSKPLVGYFDIDANDENDLVAYGFKNGQLKTLTITDIDSDGDGAPDTSDAFPDDPLETSDRDNDGIGDNSDRFPDNPLEHADRDNDGVGDNGDAFPDDPSETADTDGDGVGDNSDMFPNNPFEHVDSNGDSFGDRYGAILAEGIKAVHVGGNWGRNFNNIYDPPQEYFDYLKSLNVNWIGVSVALHYDNSMDRTVEREYSNVAIPTFNDDALENFILRGKEEGFHIYLTLAFESFHAESHPDLPAPRYLLGDPNGDSEIEALTVNEWPWNPNNSDHEQFKADFWKSYSEQAVYYAQLAQKTGVELYSLGTETDRLFRTASDEWWTTNFKVELQELVSEVRNNFDGLITYDMGFHTTTENQFYGVGSNDIWEDLDLDIVGISAYYSLADQEPQGLMSLQQLKENWRNVFHNFIKPVRDRNPTKPIFFLEFGYVDSVAAPFIPNYEEFTNKTLQDDNGNELDDGEETQNNILSAFFSVRNEFPNYVSGSFLWGNDIADSRDWESSFGGLRTFSFRDKLAEKTVKEAYASWK